MENKTVTATTARYIKLGDGGIYEQEALHEGFVPFGYSFVPHQTAQGGDFNTIRDISLQHGRTPQTAADDARQIIDFYTLGSNTLWITFAAGQLWWCFAKPEVLITPTEESHKGFRYRQTVDGWRNTDINGKPLHMSELNGNLTKKAMYRRTICNLHADQLPYLLRKINGLESPVVAAAQQAKSGILESIVSLMQELQPNDFEILVDLVFSQSGWRRLGAVGKTQKTVDMEVELPSTGERAFIQVKSHTKQWELDEYIKRFEERGDDRMFYVYHSARYGIATTHERVTLINPNRLAEMVFNAGLFDWLLQKAG